MATIKIIKVIDGLYRVEGSDTIVREVLAFKG